MATGESVVNELTGEIAPPSAFVSSLRSVERSIFRLDNAIADLKADLKAARMEREKAIAALRSMVRESKIAARARRGTDRKGDAKA